MNLGRGKPDFVITVITKQNTNGGMYVRKFNSAVYILYIMGLLTVLK